jgi:hypothetical protein
MSKVNIMFAQFVIDYLSMVLLFLFDAYTDHNAQASPVHGEASIYPQTKKSSLETSQKVICFKKTKKY